MGIYIVIFITLIASAITSLAQILFKKGLGDDAPSFVKMVRRILSSRAVIIGIFGYFLSLGIYLEALSIAPLSVVYPIFASSFIFVAVFSFIFLKERPSLLRFAGILVIFVGIVIVALSYG